MSLPRYTPTQEAQLEQKRDRQYQLKQRKAELLQTSQQFQRTSQNQLSQNPQRLPSRVQQTPSSPSPLQPYGSPSEEQDDMYDFQPTYDARTSPRMMAANTRPDQSPRSMRLSRHGQDLDSSNEIAFIKQDKIMKKYRKAQEVIADLQKQLDEKTQQIQGLARDLQDVQSQNEQDKATADRDNAEAKKSLQASLQAADRDKQELQQTIDNLLKENKRLQDENNENKKKIEQLTGIIKDVSDQADDLERDLATTRKKNKELKRKLESTQKQADNTTASSLLVSSASAQPVEADVQRELDRLRHGTRPEQFIPDLHFGIDVALAFEERPAPHRGASIAEEAAAREAGRSEVVEFARTGKTPSSALGMIEDLKRQLATASRNSSTSSTTKQLQSKIAKLEEQAKKTEAMERENAQLIERLSKHQLFQAHPSSDHHALRQGYNLVSIHIPTVSLLEDVWRARHPTTLSIDAPKPSLMLMLDFFTFNTIPSRIMEGLQPDFNLVARYSCKGDKFFLHYLQKHDVTIELYEVAVEASLIAVGTFKCTSLLDNMSVPSQQVDLFSTDQKQEKIGVANVILESLIPFDNSNLPTTTCDLCMPDGVSDAHPEVYDSIHSADDSYDSSPNSDYEETR